MHDVACEFACMVRMRVQVITHNGKLMSKPSVIIDGIKIDSMREHSRKNCGGVPPAPQNPYPIYEQNLQFSLVPMTLQKSSISYSLVLWLAQLW